MVKIKREDLNIMRNVKIIEQLKAQLLCQIGEFYRLLTKGSNIAEDAILDCVSGAVIILYILAEKLGYSYAAVDETMKAKLKAGIVAEDDIEKQGKDLSRLLTHLKQRE